MKRYMMMLTAVALVSSMAWAQDGAALYKTKCAMCHGAMGEGKVGPSLQKTALTREANHRFADQRRSRQKSAAHQSGCRA